MKTRKILASLLVGTLLLSGAAALAEENQTADILYQRTTLHREGQEYDETPLSDETVDLLLKAAFSAPSGGNQLSNNYYVITDRALMQTIQEGHPYSYALNTAPLVIVVAGDEANCKFPELLEMDAGLSAMAMQVQATALGMSSCVMSIYPQDERVNAVRAATGMPETMKPVLMVSFGYPAADVVSSASIENYDAEKVHVNYTEPTETQPAAQEEDATSSATTEAPADAESSASVTPAP